MPPWARLEEGNLRLQGGWKSELLSGGASSVCRVLFCGFLQCAGAPAWATEQLARALPAVLQPASPARVREHRLLVPDSPLFYTIANSLLKVNRVGPD